MLPSIQRQGPQAGPGEAGPKPHPGEPGPRPAPARPRETPELHQWRCLERKMGSGASTQDVIAATERIVIGVTGQAFNAAVTAAQGGLAVQKYRHHASFGVEEAASYEHWSKK